MPYTQLDAAQTQALDEALAEAAKTLAAKSAEQGLDASRVERYAYSAAVLAHAAKGTVGGGAAPASKS